MLALLRYHYRDADIGKRKERELLQLFAELQWVREKERQASEQPRTNGPAH